MLEVIYPYLVKLSKIFADFSDFFSSTEDQLTKDQGSSCKARIRPAQQRIMISVNLTAGWEQRLTIIHPFILICDNIQRILYISVVCALKFKNFCS